MAARPSRRGASRPRLGLPRALAPRSAPRSGPARARARGSRLPGLRALHGGGDGCTKLSQPSTPTPNLKKKKGGGGKKEKRKKKQLKKILCRTFEEPSDKLKRKKSVTISTSIKIHILHSKRKKKKTNKKKSIKKKNSFFLLGKILPSPRKKTNKQITPVCLQRESCSFVVWGARGVGRGINPARR